MRTRLLGLLLLTMAMALLIGCSETKTTMQASPPDTLTEAEIGARQFTPEILWKLGRVGGMQMSPDRKQVLYTVTHYSVKNNSSTSRLYVQEVDTQEPVLLTENARMARFSPDGKRVGFLRSTDSGTQLFEMDLTGGDAVQLTSFPDGITAFWYSPNGKKILYSQFVQVEKTMHDLYPEMKLANVRIIDSLMYRHWDYWVDGRYSHLFVTDYNPANISPGKDIMPGEPWDCPMAPYFDPSDVTWANNSQCILYACEKKSGRAYALGTDSDIYHYSVESGETTNLTPNNPGYDKQPVHSPDGKYMLWQQMRIPGYESDIARLMQLDMATGEVKDLTGHFDQNADHFEYAPDGETILILSALNGTHQLFALPPDRKELKQLTKGDFDVNWAGVADDGRYIVQRTQYIRAAELYSVKDNQFTPLTHINDDIYAKLDIPTFESRWIPTTDGKKMFVWVVFPPNFDPAKKYPTLLYCQGGPQSTVSQYFSYRWNIQLMASQGYIVVLPNRHGVPSFGQDWNAQISGDYCGQNIEDYLVAIDNVSQEPWSDEQKLGAVGASYGGYSVYYLAGHHEGRFKAFIAHNGMYNLESFYGATEETFFPNHDLGGPYWDKSNKVAQRSYAHSPHLFVQNWDTPIMVVVGERDFRIPYTEGLQAFNAARLRNIPAKLLVFPQETHFVTGPQNSIIWQHEFFNWLDRWLK